MREKIEKPKAGEFSEEYKNKLLELAELVLDEEGRDDVEENLGPPHNSRYHDLDVLN